MEVIYKPKRNAAVQCDCEREGAASPLQVLSLVNHPRVRQKIADDKGLVARLLKELPGDAERLDEMFLSALGRLPVAAEREACLKYVKGSKTPAEGFRGVLWSRLNTREFVLHH